MIREERLHLHRPDHRGLIDREHRARVVPARPVEAGRIGEVPVTQEKPLEGPDLDPGLAGKDPYCRRRGRQSHDPASPEHGCRCLQHRGLAGAGMALDAYNSIA